MAGDSVRRYKLPWALIATVDAYQNGKEDEQAFAVEFIERALHRPSELTRAVAPAPHTAAELLLSLRHLQGEKDVI